MIVGLLYCLLGIGVALASFLLRRLVAGFAESRMAGATTIPLALVMVGIGLVFAVLGFRLVKRSAASWPVEGLLSWRNFAISQVTGLG